MSLKERRVDKNRRKKLSEIDTKLQVVEAVRLNKSIPEIADMLNLSITTVRGHVDTALSEMQGQYLENAAKLQVINIARCEYLYSIAEVWASGKGKWEEENSEGDMIEKHQIAPDRMWMKTALDVIKAEMDISTKALKREDAEEKPPTTNINTTIIRQTLIAGDNLFETARQSMEDDWLSEESGVQWADLDGSDLIQLTSGEDFDDGAFDPRIVALEKEMGNMLTLEDDEDGDAP